MPITTAGQLIEALGNARAGDTILLPSGEYEVADPLFVPDGVTLQGAGRMQPPDGLPVKFQTGTETTIKAKQGPGFKGNLVTLGNDSSLRRLVLQGANQADFDDADRGGNVVAVASRREYDIVSATIVECELTNRITAGGGPDAPTGGAILAHTRNPKQGDDPRPHVGAQVTVALTRSIVSAKDGKAVFAMNFASHGQVTINLTTNTIGGPLDVVGGLARPDAVDHATTAVTSTGNHYSKQPGGEDFGWQITGGSSPPFAPQGTVPNTNADWNTVSANSTDDQIEDFRVGIVAVGGRRLDPGVDLCSNNTVNLTLTRMKPATNPPAGAADFEFVGALSLRKFPVGDDNTVVVDVLGGTPSKRLFHIDVDPDAHVVVGTDSFFSARLPR